MDKKKSYLFHLRLWKKGFPFWSDYIRLWLLTLLFFQFILNFMFITNFTISLFIESKVLFYFTTLFKVFVGNCDYFRIFISSGLLFSMEVNLTPGTPISIPHTKTVIQYTTPLKINLSIEKYLYVKTINHFLKIFHQKCQHKREWIMNTTAAGTCFNCTNPKWL